MEGTATEDETNQEAREKYKWEQAVEPKAAPSPSDKSLPSLGTIMFQGPLTSRGSSI